MRPPIMVRASAVLAVFALATPGGHAARAAEVRPSRVTIAFTGDVGGYLEPCG